MDLETQSRIPMSPFRKWAQVEGTATPRSPKLQLVPSSALFTAGDPPALCRTQRCRGQVEVMELSRGYVAVPRGSAPRHGHGARGMQDCVSALGLILLLFKHSKVIRGTMCPIGMGLLGRGPAGAMAGCCHPLRRHQSLGFDCGVERLPEARHSGQTFLSEISFIFICLALPVDRSWLFPW